MENHENLALKRLEDYAKKTNATENELMNIDSTFKGGSRANYEARLDRTLEHLESRIQDQSELQSTLRSASSASNIDAPSETPSENVSEEIEQIKVYIAAYKALTDSNTDLPPSDSVLPALLALRNVSRTIDGTKRSLLELKSQLDEAKEDHDRAQSNLRDDKLITESLEKRIEDLRRQKGQKLQKSNADEANEMIQKLESRSTSYKEDTEQLLNSLMTFIEDHLAAMIAAEELGGPVVNGATGLDLDEEPRDKKQRRIDVIWKQEKSRGKDTEIEAAAAEIRALIEELLNASVSGGTAGSGAYVELERDSATVRFLVRARIAQFHPRDARRLRLFDFGRDYDD